MPWKHRTHANDEKERIDGIAKKEQLLSELAILPPCLDPDCPDHTTIKNKDNAIDHEIKTKPPQKRKGNKVDSKGFVFLKNLPGQPPQLQIPNH
ncbi:hypothetical protein TNCT_638131 [Trichonephila clavata]|uniref:Uncharacterized protein n=1 Tax=Trichonephila clavata TaxID=2740835 RepID=A0A8X6FAX3_TRICU|nr:hypothetical protein TNCT_638131 [Trichonephila clavata]